MKIKVTYDTGPVEISLPEIEIVALCQRQEAREALAQLQAEEASRLKRRVVKVEVV